MKETLTLLLLATLAWSQTLNGTVTVHTINSTILGFRREIQVYTPQGYNGGSQQYPVIYFLHGFIGNHLSFGYVNEVVDELISSGTIPPVVVVKPNGAVNGTVPPIGSLWTNSVKNGRYEDYFLDEVVPWAETTFRIKRAREYRLVMGHSFGGSAAIRLALQHLDVFGSVASHSGFVKMDANLIQFYVNVSVFVENNGTAISPNPSKLFTTFIFTAASAWSPNLSSPFGVDLPMINDGSGILNPSVVARWEAFSPHKVIVDVLANLTSKPLGLFYFDVGTRDELQLLRPNEEFAAQLASLNVSFTFVTYDGPHNNASLLRLQFAKSITDWAVYLRREFQTSAATSVTVAPTSNTQATSNNDSGSSSVAFFAGIAFFLVFCSL